MNPAPRVPAKKLVLFHRDFQRFTGGHLKVWDYFNHVATSPVYEARIAFSADSKWDATNPWLKVRGFVVGWGPEHADILFLAGTDWRALQDRQLAKPIINFIQHPRHADVNSELRGYLKNRAVRICVSEEVAAAIKKTGEVNGPVFVIPNGINLPENAATSLPDRQIHILICGLKAPELAREVTAALTNQDRPIRCLTDWIPRVEYLDLLRSATITLFLPRPVEGFYLPALEGMACGTVVVCPDCIGNRSFCLDRVNCFRPEHNPKAIVSAAMNALEQSSEERTRMLERAQGTALEHSLMTERENFHRILMQLDELLAR